MTLTGSYQTAPPPCNSISDVEPNNSMSVPQVISGNCNQISGAFLNDPTPTGNYNYDFYRVSLPAGATVTALPSLDLQDHLPPRTSRLVSIYTRRHAEPSSGDTQAGTARPVRSHDARGARRARTSPRRRVAGRCHG